MAAFDAQAAQPATLPDGHFGGVGFRAGVDALTGLPNGGAFQVELARAAGGVVLVCALDLANFGAANACLGARAADDVLRRWASAIAGACARVGARAFRRGVNGRGDEFAMLCAL